MYRNERCKEMSISKDQIKEVKGRGFLLNRGTENFSGRIVTPAGLFTPDELRSISECSEKFGNGKVIFTSRLAAEIAGIPFEKVPEAENFMKERGLYFGGTGAKIRPVAACKGTTCVYGNIDTQALAKTIYDKFYIGMKDVKLPHKFKIAVGGCPNSCMKPTLNDVGIEGHKSFTFDRDICRGCKKCAVEANCPSKAVTVIDGKAVTDGSKCTKCGVCVGKCPFGAVPKQAESVCYIYAGGTWGKKQRMGTLIPGSFNESEVPDMILKIMLWFKENAYSKERLGAAIDRLGVEKLIADLSTDDLLKRKDEILAKPVLEH
jgi:dissimilatory sulfite reductase (desulfoviridin) alpha/beta subunit